MKLFMQFLHMMRIFDIMILFHISVFSHSKHRIIQHQDNNEIAIETWTTAVHATQSNQTGTDNE